MASNAETFSRSQAMTKTLIGIRNIGSGTLVACLILWIVGRGAFFASSDNPLNDDFVVMVGYSIFTLVIAIAAAEFATAIRALIVSPRNAAIIARCVVISTLAIHAIISFGSYRLLALIFSTTILELQTTAKTAMGILMQANAWFPAAPIVLMTYANQFPASDVGSVSTSAISITLGFAIMLMLYVVVRSRLVAKSDGLNAKFAPPSGLAIVVIFIFILPVAADLYNEFAMADSRQDLTARMQQEARARTHVVSALAVNVRNAPDNKSPSYGQLSFLDEVGVIEDRNGWSRIGNDRWVSSSYLAPLAEAIVARGTFILSAPVTSSDDIESTNEVNIEVIFTSNDPSVRGRYRVGDSRWGYVRGIRRDAGALFKLNVANGSAIAVAIEPKCESFGKASSPNLTHCLSGAAIRVNDSSEALPIIVSRIGDFSQ